MIIYTYQCPQCGKVTRDISVKSQRHESCPKVQPGPYLVLTHIFMEGVDKEPWKAPE